MRGDLAGELLPLPVPLALDLLKDVALIVFIEVAPLDCDCVIEFGTVVLVVLGAVVSQFKAKSAKLPQTFGAR